jgi:chemotaxis protein MotC
MRRVRIAAATFAAALLLPASVFAEDTEEMLVKEVRAIAQQYDGISNRSFAQSSDLSHVRERYLAVLRKAAEAGNQGQALRAMAEVFVLSGGDVTILAHWKDGLDRNSAEAQIFKGVMAYGEGKTVEAEARLLPLDAMGLDNWRGGHLALAQALLTIRTDPKRATAYLKTAAFLLPGTLVEEAALRQRAILAAKTSDFAEFSSAVTTYFRRFPNSAYLGGFETQAIFYILRFEPKDGVAVLREILQVLPNGWGRCLSCFLMTIAEQAILTGKLELAQTATAAAVPLVPTGGPEAQRLTLYSGAMAILRDKIPEGLEILRSVDVAKLGTGDKEIRDASIAVADKLQKTPVLFTQLDRKAAANPVKGNRIFPAGGREEAARRTLAEVDTILENAR